MLVNYSTVDSTSVYTLWILYRSYFKDISANIELQVYSKRQVLLTVHRLHFISINGF
jgi:hypothetical protein